ncbi:hypothetical protein [Tenacibaculum phage Larrie]|nr:hypothetical protein [Tenacibaculum phage Larrie]
MRFLNRYVAPENTGEKFKSTDKKKAKKKKKRNSLYKRVFIDKKRGLYNRPFLDKV